MSKRVLSVESQDDVHSRSIPGPSWIPDLSKFHDICDVRDLRSLLCSLHSVKRARTLMVGLLSVMPEDGKIVIPAIGESNEQPTSVDNMAIVSTSKPNRSTPSVEALSTVLERSRVLHHIEKPRQLAGNWKSNRRDVVVTSLRNEDITFMKLYDGQIKSGKIIYAHPTYVCHDTYYTIGNFRPTWRVASGTWKQNNRRRFSDKNGRIFVKTSHSMYIPEKDTWKLWTLSLQDCPDLTVYHYFCPTNHSIKLDITPKEKPSGSKIQRERARFSMETTTSLIEHNKTK